jgi:hypothetical protein
MDSNGFDCDKNVVTLNIHFPSQSGIAVHLSFCHGLPSNEFSQFFKSSPKQFFVDMELAGIKSRIRPEE